MMKDQPPAPEDGPSLEPVADQSTLAEDEENAPQEKKIDLNKVFADFSGGSDDDA